MTDWTARIDALLAEKPEYPRDIYDHHNWQVDRLAHRIAERLNRTEGDER